MAPAKLSALFVVLATSSCLAVIRIKTTEPEALYVEATVNILKSCYANRGHGIVLVGDAPADLAKALSLSQPIPVVLFSARRARIERFFVPLNNRLHRLQIFVIVAPSFKQLLLNIEQIRETSWWNHMGSFLIVMWPPNPVETCRSVPNIMYGAWQRDLLHAKAICYHSIQKRFLIYGHNPYTNEAPRPWQLIGTGAVNGRHPWSLFVRIYEEDRSVCHNLDYDKTKDLGGHPVTYLMLTSAAEMKDVLAGSSVEHYNFGLAMRVLNATGKFWPRLIDYEERHAYRELQFEYADLCVNPVEAYANSLPAVYPFLRRHLHIMTQFPGHKTQLEKILGVIDVPSRINVYSALFITALFFNFVVHQTLALATLNVVRIICNMGFENIPRGLAARLYITGILLSAVTMQGIYQGQLASLLTTNVSLPLVNSVEDLAESDHTIYGFARYAGFFDDEKFGRRFVYLHNPNCTKFVRRDPLAACIDFERLNLTDDAKAYKLHLSAKPIATLEITWMARKNWPLKEKFDKLGQSMFETDITIPFQARLNRVTAADFIDDEYVQSNTDIRVMTFSDLRFAFVILLVGLTLASISFLVEIVIFRCRSDAKVVPVGKFNVNARSSQKDLRRANRRSQGIVRVESITSIS